MKRILALTGVVVVVMGVLFTAAMAEEEKKAALDGKTLFLEQKCANCHAVASMKIEKKAPAKEGAEKADAGSKKKEAPDLSDLGSRVKADWLSPYLMKTADLKGVKHMTKFKGNADSLKVMVDWLMTLKTASK